MNVTKLEVPFGQSGLSVQLPTANLLEVLVPREEDQASDEATLLSDALAHPIGTPRLRELAQPGQKVVIVTSDLTRPCPSERLLPPLLGELQAAGVSEARPADSDTVLRAAPCRRESG